MSNINQLCYCGQDLIHDPDPDTRSCGSCCKQITDAETYWCNNASCRYKEISNQPYVICTDCYERDDSEYKHNYENGYDLFVKKLINSVNIIRSVHHLVHYIKPRKFAYYNYL